MSIFLKRMEAVRDFLKAGNADAAFFFDPENRRYLSGFKGSTGYVLITEDENLFFADSRYTEQAKQECPDYTVVPFTAVSDVFDGVGKRHPSVVAVERNSMSAAFYDQMKESLQARLVSADELIAGLRMIKDETETALIRRACDLTDQAFRELCGYVYEGITEREIDRFLQDKFRSYPEVEQIANRFIVASGGHAALPHGIAGLRKVQAGDMVMIDFGCNVDGYWSDVTRTIFIGKAPEEARKIYETVKLAQRTAMEAVRPGISGRQIDALAREVIGEAGYGPYFGHNLGHSFGLGIHEKPFFAPNDKDTRILEPGMIMTVEPGIYIPEVGGVRIEDDILVTETGYEVLSHAPKDLMEL